MCRFVHLFCFGKRGVCHKSASVPSLAVDPRFSVTLNEDNASSVPCWGGGAGPPGRVAGAFSTSSATRSKATRSSAFCSSHCQFAACLLTSFPPYPGAVGADPGGGLLWRGRCSAGSLEQKRPGRLSADSSSVLWAPSPKAVRGLVWVCGLLVCDFFIWACGLFIVSVWVCGLFSSLAIPTAPSFFSVTPKLGALLGFRCPWSTG